MSREEWDLSGMEAGLYLRKSRMEEGLDTNEVLARHQKALLDYAGAKGIRIVQTYPEVVSGESLYARPQMLRLLHDVEEGRYDCVLCMDLDRLSRGRMKDQGVILDAFRDSATLIVTPEKAYDLSDELDDELAEMKTFISRREYKIINKRLRRGLQQSIESGCYVSNAPYGYRKATRNRRPTLEIYEPEAKFVRMMFQLYAQGYGCVSVARHVTALGARPHRSQEFCRNSVVKILRNPTYIGKVVWNQKKHIRKGCQGNAKHMTLSRPRDQWTVTDGLHPPIVGQELFLRVQSILDGRALPAKRDGTVKSALAGLVQCAVCGQNMQRLVMKGTPYLLCTRPGCCSSVQFSYVEDRILTYLESVLSSFSLSNHTEPRSPRGFTVPEASLEAVGQELAAARRQRERLYELLELGEYDLPTFRARMEALRARIAALEKKEAETARIVQKAQTASAVSSTQILRTLLEAYPTADAAQRNAMLRCVVQEIRYWKEKKSKPADFILDIRLQPF